MRIRRLDMFTCQQALERLYDYLDHYIDDGDRKLVAEHVAMCEACTRRFGFERRLLDGIGEKAAGANVPADVKQRLERMLQNLRGSDRIR